MNKKRSGNQVPEINFLETVEVNGRQAKRVVPIDLFGNLADDLTPLRVDEADGATTYIGFAELGTAESTLAWRILKVETTGTETTLTYPNGSMAFTSRWSDRGSLVYS